MNEYISKKKNIFQRKLLEIEKKRIDDIIIFLHNLKDENKLKDKDFKNIKKKYENIFRNKLEKKENEKKILIETKNYLELQINEIMKNNKSNFLLEELAYEIDKINEVLKDLI